MEKYFSHGKLLISGEYVVLDGATAFALPTRFGQSLEVESSEKSGIRWKSIDEQGKIWFEHTFQKGDFSAEFPAEQIAFDSPRKEIGQRLFSVLRAANMLEPGVFSGAEGFDITTKADFPLDWGLGTSSTLIANISKWLKIDAFGLLDMTFGGSGYDIAVAFNAAPITYELHGNDRSVLHTSFNPNFIDQLFFVHLNKKQDSRRSIEDYHSKDKEFVKTTVEKISVLTHKIITCSELDEFKLLLEIHEKVISHLTGFKMVKSSLFPDYSGAIKSLGGWGGDFILVTGQEQDMNYFRRKGYETIIPYGEMILF